MLFHVAGLNGRYTRSQRLLSDDQFMEYWLGNDTPAAVIVFLDGESHGDSYQMNSAVSGPYADANFTELFPYLVEQFPIEDLPSNWFVSGVRPGDGFPWLCRFSIRIISMALTRSAQIRRVSGLSARQSLQ